VKVEGQLVTVRGDREFGEELPKLVQKRRVGGVESRGSRFGIQEGWASRRKDYFTEEWQDDRQRGISEFGSWKMGLKKEKHLLRMKLKRNGGTRGKGKPSRIPYHRQGERFGRWEGAKVSQRKRQTKKKALEM